MSAHSSKVEVLWSPNKEEDFATYGTELKLYNLCKTEDSVRLPPNALSVSPYNHGSLVGTFNSDVHCMPVYQCVAWQVNQDRPYFFAVGQSGGKVLLANLGLDQPGAQSSNRHVLSPRNGRPCTCLAWNPSETHLLAEGLEKSRNDNSLIVWDIERAPSENQPLTPATTERSRLTSSLRQLVPIEQPPAVDDSAKYFEIGSGESTSSLAWLPSQPSCIIAGMGNRFIRMFDTREHRSGLQVHPREVANHKALYGLCIDPQDGNRLASYAEGGTVYLWDIRHFARPTYSFSRSGTILRLSWMPTRCGSLSVLLSEQPYVRILDLPSFNSPSSDEQTELYSDHLTLRMADRCPYYSDGKNGSKLTAVTGVTWHPKWDSFGLLANVEGGVSELNVYDKMPVSWSAHVELMYAGNSKLFGAQVEPKVKVQDVVEEDISTQMIRRVREGYGFDPEANCRILHNEPVVRGVWKWVQLHKELVMKGDIPGERNAKTLLGVCSVLGADKPIDYELPNPNPSSKRVSWQERDGASHGDFPHFSIFVSKERRIALKLCGWSFDNGGLTLEDFLKRQEFKENFERAAAVAVFHGHIRRGITSLKDGAAIAKQQGDTGRGNLLNLIALALSGYTSKESQLWRETCFGVKSQISNPYLRATFNFLCSSGRDAFSDVLNETEMSLQDRVAFACTYLDDRMLYEHISILTKHVKSRGDMNGLFLTGLPNDGVTLLANYVNQTGDVQLACLLSGQVMSGVAKIKQVQAWFQGYRDLLDRWQMWHERALFDGQRKKLDPSYKPQKQAFVICSFCSKSIASDSQRNDRRSAYHSAAMGRKAASCPNCRKPLPRCSLCLLNMVAISNKQTSQTRDTTTGSQKPSDQFGHWFTWCQNCRHGGHANHIAEWFNNHQECPVTGCTCHCFSLDATV